MALISVEELERSGANPYEVAIAASKRARVLNELLRRRGKLDVGEEDKPAVVALKEMVEGRIRCVYSKGRG